jgi:hypothetical protein
MKSSRLLPASSTQTALSGLGGANPVCQGKVIEGAFWRKTDDQLQGV